MASVWAVIEDKQRILLVQRSAQTSRPGQWCLPGGGIHVGEDAEAACVREVAEEVGLRAKVLGLLANYTDQYFFRCTIEEGEVHLKANECQAYAWVKPESMLELGPIMDLKKIRPILAQLGYCCSGME